MKHLKNFKHFEAVIIPDKLNINNKLHTFDDIKKLGEENDFDVVNYQEFIESLPENEKDGAPSKDPRAPFFALFHPDRKKPMFVISDENSIRFLPYDEILKDIIGHERIHKQQVSRSKIEYKLPDPKNKEKYFSDKNEIMAFSYTIANIINKNINNFKEAKMLLKYLSEDNRNEIFKMIRKFDYNDSNLIINLYKDIKLYTDEIVFKRYNKYIYQYLDEMYN
jgi:hypothetical protein